MESNSFINYKGIYEKVKEQLVTENSKSRLIELEFSMTIGMLSTSLTEKERWKGHKLLNSIYLHRTENEKANDKDHLQLMLKVIHQYRKKGKIEHKLYQSNIQRLMKSDLSFILLPSELEAFPKEKEQLIGEINKRISDWGVKTKKDFAIIKEALTEPKSNNAAIYLINLEFVEKLIIFIEAFLNDEPNKVSLFPGVIDNSIERWRFVKKEYPDTINLRVWGNKEEASFMNISCDIWKLISLYFQSTNEITYYSSMNIKGKGLKSKNASYLTVILSNAFSQNDELNYLLKPRYLTIYHSTLSDFKEMTKSILDQYNVKENNPTIKLYKFQKSNEANDYDTLAKLILAAKISLPFHLHGSEVQTDEQLKQLDDCYLIIEVFSSKSNIILPPFSKCNGCNKTIKEKGTKCECSNALYCRKECLAGQNHMKFHSIFYQYFLHPTEGDQMTETNSITLLVNTTPNGRIGFVNLGNTCYMNCVLQCLSNTIPLKEHILSLALDREMLSGKIPPIFLQFFNLMKEMWVSKKRYDVINPVYIRDAIVAYFTHFDNKNMQDAHEFLFMLLDYFNSELGRVDELVKELDEVKRNSNRLSKPNQIEDNIMNDKDMNNVNSIKDPNSSDKKEIEKSWSIINENEDKKEETQPKSDSNKTNIISELFYGQLQSCIRCKGCQHKAFNYEPFNCLSLPIPKEKKHITFYFLPLDHTKRPEAYQMDIFIETKSKKLKDLIIAKNPILDYDLIEVVLYKPKKSTLTLKDNERNVWKYFNKSIMILFFEKQDKTEKGAFYFHYSVNNKQSDIYRFGFNDPNAYFTDYLNTIKQSICHITQKELTEFNIKIAHSCHGNGVCLICGTTTPHYCNIPNEKVPLKTLLDKKHLLYIGIDIFDSSLSLARVPFHLHTVDVIQNEDITLLNCLDLFSSFEDIQWKCPGCQKPEQAEKSLRIHTPPKYLILQLNRFKFGAGLMKLFKNKNNTMVTFPVKALNLMSHVVKKEIREYDLYGVINHLSWFSGFGHYIAICNNEDNWIKYNDQKVEVFSEKEIKGVPKKPIEKEIVTSNAYLLFYKMTENNSNQ